MTKLLAALLLPTLVGCATILPQTDTVLRDPPSGFRFAQAEVPFVSQSEGNCGPATLAMTMQWAGRQVTETELAPKVATPSKKGSLQLDLVGAARREGMFAVQIHGLQALLAEVGGGHPVIVLENQGLSWAPVWHYAVVVGYDLDRQEMILHTGSDSAKRVRVRRFEDAWAKGNHWGLVVLSPGELSISADELAQMRAAAGLEQAGRTAEAELAYRAVLERWPTSLAAMIGLGNLAYNALDFAEAVRVLKRALELHPDSQIVRNNLEVANSAAR